MPLNLSADEVLTSTRAVRKRLDFDRPVGRELIEECLQIAMQAPSAGNDQAWHWVMVEDPAQKLALADIYRRNFEGYPDRASKKRYPGGDPRAGRLSRVIDSAAYLAENFHRAPVLMVPCITAKLDGAGTMAAASAWGSLLPAVWSFMLAARERGLGTAWTTIHLMNGGDALAAEVLGLPDTVTQAGLFPIAHTIGTEFKPASRLSLDQVVHWDRW